MGRTLDVVMAAMLVVPFHGRCGLLSNQPRCIPELPAPIIQHFSFLGISIGQVLDQYNFES